MVRHIKGHWYLKKIYYNVAIQAFSRRVAMSHEKFNCFKFHQYKYINIVPVNDILSALIWAVDLKGSKSEI